MHLKALPKGTHKLLEPLRDIVEKSSFVLAGGTALALQFGHRLSEDYDFFSCKDFSVPKLLKQVSQMGKVTVLLQDKDTLVVMVKKVKLSFFRYWDQFLFPAVTSEYFDMADPRDIMLMKLVALANRGARKDFVDVYFLCQKTISLKESFQLLETKFKKTDYNPYHILKSLNYFDDAESEPMPKMLVPLQWEDVKRYFRHQFSKEFS